jgi:6-pyruvoyltetrahydropterin/6-carboxytetrahydropterin synthase
MTSSIVIQGGFEAAHRLPQLGGACASIHGHSWQLAVTVTAPGLAADGTVAEFGAFKRAVRAWTDAHLDNGAMLGIADPLLAAFTADGSKTFRFGAAEDASEAEEFACDQAWPTVEAVAIVIARVAGGRLAVVAHAPGAAVTSVLVKETQTNSAVWTRGDGL